MTGYGHLIVSFALIFDEMRENLKWVETSNPFQRLYLKKAIKYDSDFVLIL